MMTRGIKGRVMSAIVAFACAIAWAGAVEAQTAIGVGNPGPVVPQNGLLGTYYNNTGNGGTGLGPPPLPPPGSPIGTANNGLSVQFLQRIDGPVDFNFQNTPPPGVNNTPTTCDHVTFVWEGFIISSITGNLTVAVGADDGMRCWLTTISGTPPIDMWAQGGDRPSNTVIVAGVTTGQRIPIRFEFYEHEGGAAAHIRWGPTANPANTIIPAANLAPPDGPNAPGSFTVTTVPNRQTPQVDISWAASTTPVAATNYILSRATAAGGPYTQIAVQAGTTFTDTAVTFGTTYYYRVQGTALTNLLVGPATAAQSGTPTAPALGVSPTANLMTSEGGLNATITLTVNASPTGSNFTFQMTSSDTTEANLSGGGQPQGSPINLTIPMGTAVGTQIVITVHGLDDFLADGNQTFNITFGNFAGGGAPYAGLAINPINGTNQDNDTPNIIISGISGNTTESGGTATFSVTFATQPTATTTIAVSSSDTGEGTVNPPTLSFTNANWNTPHVVTVTGVDDTLLDFGQFYTVSLTVNGGGDATYFNMTAPPNGPRTVTVLNVDNETIPTLPPVWGKGGCGLSGAEILLPLGLLALWRRRRRS